MDHVWEAYSEQRDWEGYTKNMTQLSLHRTKEGAERAVKAFEECYPNLARSMDYITAVRPRKLED